MAQRITVELDTPVMYSGTSGEVEGSFIEIDPPNGKVASYVGTLKAEMGKAELAAMKAIGDQKAAKPEKDAKPPTADERGATAFAILTMGGANLPVCLETFKAILRESATMAGEKTFTSPMYDRMAYDDIERGFKKYLGTFISASE